MVAPWALRIPGSGVVQMLIARQPHGLMQRCTNMTTLCQHAWSDAYLHAACTLVTCTFIQFRAFEHTQMCQSVNCTMREESWMHGYHFRINIKRVLCKKTNGENLTWKSLIVKKNKTNKQTKMNGTNVSYTHHKQSIHHSLYYFLICILFLWSAFIQNRLKDAYHIFFSEQNLTIFSEFKYDFATT